MYTTFKRIGSFMIDMSIINMFSRVFYQYILGHFIHITKNNLVYDIFVALFYILIIMAIAIGYQLICYKFIKNSLGKELMQIKYYNSNGTDISLEVLVKREMIKYYLIYVTMLIYVPYSFLKMKVTKTDLSFHDKKTSTCVLSKNR